MSEPNEQPDPHDEARDRLTDRVLAEALGAESPPDLSDAIASRLEEAQSVPHSAEEKAMQSRRAWMVLLTTAASLMLAAFLLRGGTRALDEGLVAMEAAKAHEKRLLATSRYEAIGLASEDSTLASQSSEAPSTSQSTSRKQPSIELESLLRSQNEPTSTDSKPLMYVGNYGADADDVADIETQPPAAPASTAPPSSGLGGVERTTQSAPRTAFNRLSLEAGDIVDTRELRKSERRLRASSVFNANPALGKSPTTNRYYAGAEIRLHDGEADQWSYPKRNTLGFHQDRFRRWPEPPSSDRYEPIHENDFITPRGGDALSTFSIDVDTASYSNVRRFLMESRRLPDPNAVRIEELVNYFEYAYTAPEAESEDPFAASLEVGYCPWNSAHRLVQIGIKGREIDADKRPLSNLVFLVDVSGSMQDLNKLPLVIEGLKALTDKLGENDRVAIVVYAGNEGLVLPSTSGTKKDEIRSALSRLTAGGSTAGGAGLKLAYELAERNRIVGGVNRVVLCTDGDFNVGLTGTEELAELVETRAKETGVFLTVLGFGSGNLNDAMLETISGRGDGHYAYIDSESEARRVLSRDLSGTLVTIAKDVKIQVEFNPAKVASYRLIGYENRVMAAEDFNDDTKDAGEIGAGHTVTALYEVVPVGVEPPTPPVDGLKYQQAEGGEPTAASDQTPAADRVQLIPDSNEMLTLKIRYKQPEGGASKKLEFPLEDPGADARLQESIDFHWAASVAEFGMLLRNSRHRGEATFEHVLESARTALGEDPHGYRSQMIDMVRRAQELSKGARR